MSYYQPGAADKLLPLLREIAAKHQVTLPDFEPPAKQKAAYEAYIRALGRQPSEVDPMIDIARVPPEKRAEIHAQLLLALMNADKLGPNELKGILMLATTMVGEHRASALVQILTAKLVDYCRGQDVALPELTSGVFPMRWFNAQCALYDGSPIVLLSNGCMSLIEIAVILFIASSKDMKYARRALRAAVLSYVDSGGKVEPANYELGQGRVEFSSPIIHSLLNATEEFVIAHELAHIALGHMASTSLHAAPLIPPERTLWQRALGRDTGTATIEVTKKNHFQEHQADLWAYRVILQRAKVEATNEAAVPVAAASAVVFLGINLLVEAAHRERGVELADTHPDGLARLYMVQLMTELEGCHEEAFIARRFYEFVEEVGRDFPSLKMPPFLSRDLNRAAVPVLESLHVDLRNARYINEFV